MKGQNGLDTVFWGIGWTDLYDFWYQIEGEQYLGLYVLIFYLGPLGATPQPFLVAKKCCHLLRNWALMSANTWQEEKEQLHAQYLPPVHIRQRTFTGSTPPNKNPMRIMGYFKLVAIIFLPVHLRCKKTWQSNVSNDIQASLVQW